MTEWTAAALDADVDSLSEAEAKALLEEAGISVPDGSVASDVTEAVEAAATIGYPVILKVHGRSITHKSEWGDGVGVQLDIADETQLRAAYERIATATPFDEATNVLVEAAADVEHGVELLVSGFRHDSFGPVLVFGLGGVYTEVFDDVTYRLAPVSTTEARSMLTDIRGEQLLTGFRSKPVVDRAALADVICRLSDLLNEYPEVQEVELNPVLATETGVIALDAVVHL